MASTGSGPVLKHRLDLTTTTSECVSTFSNLGWFSYIYRHGYDLTWPMRYIYWTLLLSRPIVFWRHSIVLSSSISRKSMAHDSFLLKTTVAEPLPKTLVFNQCPREGHLKRIRRVIFNFNFLWLNMCVYTIDGNEWFGNGVKNVHPLSFMRYLTLVLVIHPIIKPSRVICCLLPKKYLMKVGYSAYYARQVTYLLYLRSKLTKTWQPLLRFW